MNCPGFLTTYDRIGRQRLRDDAFRKAVLEVKEADWQPLYRTADGCAYRTDQEWTEVGFVPTWAGYGKTHANSRFLAICEPLRQFDLGDADQLPFPTQEFAGKGRFTLFGIVTNRTLRGDQVIWWLRERCGKSEEVHAALKSDLAAILTIKLSCALRLNCSQMFRAKTGGRLYGRLR
jgi:hypothetical protein